MDTLFLRFYLQIVDFQLDHDASMLFWELDCIRQKVDKDLQITSFVTHKPFKQINLVFAKVCDKFYLLEASVMVDDRDSLFNYIEEVYLTQVDLECLIFKLCEVKKVKH